MEFYKMHCAEVIESHPDEQIEIAIACYAELLKQEEQWPR